MNANRLRAKWYRISYRCHRLAWPWRWLTLYFAVLAVIEFFELHSGFARFPRPISHFLNPVSQSAITRINVAFRIEIAWVVVFGLLTLISAWFNVWFRYAAWWVVKYWRSGLVMVVAAALIIWRRALGIPLWIALKAFVVSGMFLKVTAFVASGVFLKVAGAVIILLFLYGVYRARNRLVILPFANYTGDDKLKCCVEGLAPLLLNELGRIGNLYTTLDEALLPEAERDLAKGLPATVSVEDVGEVLQSTVSPQSQIKFWGIEIPMGSILRIFGRLARGPRLSGSLHKEGERLVLIAILDGGRLKATSWRVSPEDLPEAAVDSGTELVGKMMDQLAYRVFADLVPTSSPRWRAVRCYADGLRVLRIAKRTEKDKKANLRQAERAFLQALGEDNKFARCHYNLGVVYTALNEGDAAQAVFCAALKQDPKLTQAYYALANDSWNRGDYGSAISYCDQVIALRPTVARAWDLKALAERKLQEERLGTPLNPEDWRQSLESREIAAALAWRALCGAGLRGRSLDDAKEVARKCLRGAAVAHASTQRLRWGISIMEQALYLAPADTDLHFELGKILSDENAKPSKLWAFVIGRMPRELGKREEVRQRRKRLLLGVDHFRTATRIEPRGGLYWAYLAESLAHLFEDTKKKEFRQDARAACEHAMDYASGMDKDSRDKVQAALKAIGEDKQAQKVSSIPDVLKDLEARRNEDRAAYLNRLKKWEQSGQGGLRESWIYGQVAGRLAQELLQTPTDAPRAQQLADHAIRSLSGKHLGEVRELGLKGTLARAYLYQEKPELLPKALLYAQRAVAINPKRDWERSILADVYWTLGQYQSAEAEWKTCLDLNPDAEFWARIASAHWNRGVQLRDPVERKKAFRSVIEVYGQALKIIESTDLRDEDLDQQIAVRGSIHYWTGRFHLELLEYDQAVAHLLVAKNMGYKPLESTVSLGVAHTEAKNYDDAENSFREAVRRVRDQRKQGKGLKEFDSGPGEEMSINELLILTYLNWSFSYSERGTNLLKKAERLTRKTRRLIRQLDASKAQQYQSNYSDCLGYAQLKSGRVQEAVEEFKRSLEMGVRPGACIRLAEAYWKQGTTDKTVRDSCIDKARECCAWARDADLRQRYGQRIKDLKDRLSALAKAP